MSAEQIFWWALAFIAADTAMWVATVTVFAAVALFKPRGKVTSRHVVMRDRDPKVRS